MIKIERIYPPNEINKESIADYLAKCGSVVRGKMPKDNMKLFNRLSTEAYGNTASRMMEYVPITIDKNMIYNKANKLFGFYGEFNKYHTNLRELMNWGCSWHMLEEYIDFSNYFVIKVNIPYFIIAQIQTHTQITSVMHSKRYTSGVYDFWCPPEFFKWSKVMHKQKYWNEIILKSSPIELKKFMKDELGIKRLEIYNRGKDSLQYREITLGGSRLNPNAWDWFFNQRLDSHTQKETIEAVKLIKEIYEETSTN